MTEKDNDDPKSKFELKLAPFSYIAHLIDDGRSKEVDPAELSAEIREHGIEKMPAQVVEFLCDHLEDKIETRGPKNSGEMEKTLKARYANFLYTQATLGVKGAPEALPEFVALIEQNLNEFPPNIPDNEIAWRIVSVFLQGQPGHYRKLSNLVSKYAPLSEETENKSQSQ